MFGLFVRLCSTPVFVFPCIPLFLVSLGEDTIAMVRKPLRSLRTPGIHHHSVGMSKKYCHAPNSRQPKVKWKAQKGRERNLGKTHSYLYRKIQLWDRKSDFVEVFTTLKTITFWNVITIRGHFTVESTKARDGEPPLHLPYVSLSLHFFLFFFSFASYTQQATYNIYIIQNWKCHVRSFVLIK